MERSVEVVTAIVGILKAEAAYLPLDSRAPAERLRWMIEDSGAAAVIIDRQLAGLAASLKTTARVIALDDIPNEETGPPPCFDALAAIPERLVYVIYTSGSTGQPKGVEIVARGLFHFLKCMRQELDFQPTDTMLAIAPLSFDVSVFELLLPLYCGGRVVVLPWPAGADGESLATAIHAYEASVVLATPTTWQLLLDNGWRGAPWVRAVCGGEILRPSLAQRLAPLTRELWNHYGPTETTIAASTYRVLSGEPSVPIGSGIDGIRLFVLDSNGNAVPSGGVGELYIGGIQLARGYRNRPELTAQRFLNVSVGGRSIRAYRTGDLVRYDERGALHVLGRADNQVKIRGYRVELEEIEAVLSLHPDVKQAAVVARKHTEDDVRLMAFAMPRDGAAADAASLIDFLAERLPAYMVPRQVHFVESLPKTVHGKVDRNALDAWRAAESDTHHTFEWRGEDPLESELLAIWRRLPGFESIGVEDSFFDFGGHSILAAKLMKDVRAKFGTELPLSTLFRSPTVKDLARTIGCMAPTKPWSPLVLVRGGGSRPPLFCVHGIRGNVLNFEPLARHLPSEQPMYALEARGLNGEAPHKSIEDMARCYIQALREVQRCGPYLLAGFSAGGIVAFEMARQLSDRGDRVALLCLLDTALYSRPAEAVDAIAECRGARLRKLKRGFQRFCTMNFAERRASLLRNGWHYSQLFAVSTRARVEALAGRCGVPVQAPAKMKDAFLLALRRYRPVMFRGAMVLYRATNGVGRDDERPAMGWAPIAPGVVVEMIHAGHPGILSEPAVIAVARSLDQRISEALAAVGEAANDVLPEHCLNRSDSPTRV
jgi:amino acid adenylation domain-containing protein